MQINQDTNVPGIHAIGDVTGKVPLMPVAIAAGRRLAERLFDSKPDSRVDYTNVPSVVFSHPPVATVGMTKNEHVSVMTETPAFIPANSAPCGMPCRLLVRPRR